MSTRYEANVSVERLDIIRQNECENDVASLSTKRFRAFWNEIEELRAALRLLADAGPTSSAADMRGVARAALAVSEDH